MLIMEALFILAVVTTLHTSPICFFFCDIPLSGDNVQWQSNCKCFVNAHVNVPTNLHQKHNLYKFLLRGNLLKIKSDGRHEHFSHEYDKSKVNMKTHYKKKMYSAIENNVKRYKRSIELSHKLKKKHIEVNTSETKNNYERKIIGYVSIHALILATVSGTAKSPKKTLTSKQANTREFDKYYETNDILHTDKYGIKNTGTMMSLKFTIGFDNINDSTTFSDTGNILPSESVTPSLKDRKIILTTDELLKNINDDKNKSVVPTENVTRLELKKDLTNVTEAYHDISFRNIKNKKNIEINEGNRKFYENLKYIENNQNYTSPVATNTKRDNTTVKKLNEPLNCTSHLKDNTKNCIFNSNNTTVAIPNMNITEQFRNTINNTLQKKFNNVFNTSDITLTTKIEDIYDFHNNHPQILNKTDLRSKIIDPTNEENKQLSTNNREETFSVAKSYITNISLLLPNLTLTTKYNKHLNINKTANIFHNTVSPYKEKPIMINNNDVITVLANAIKNSSNEININSSNNSSIIIDIPKINNSNRAQYQEGEIPVIRILSHEFPNDTVISVINGTEILPNKDFITYENNMRKSDQNGTKKISHNINSLSLLQTKNEERTSNYLLDDKLIPFNGSIVGRLYFITDHKTIPALFVQKTNGDVHLGLNISNICKKTNCSKL
ncbi:probable cyclin-dependent serine/threonine-protein kinase DDB_G0292550 [Vanessa atalanta]|uniref:probable cyclin-dependent serine/threonine-protein kinase DDB_G0292550 n=1 Tax=Vanessa atalanta TaxID=42275 RepID=UPI001FCCD088|nr:probable cyclin-dependent serine/threonine-protein kinase DDB_G0292550 [Vanessa atalanta]